MAYDVVNLIIYLITTLGVPIFIYQDSIRGDPKQECEDCGNCLHQESVSYLSREIFGHLFIKLVRPTGSFNLDQSEEFCFAKTRA